MRAALIPPRGYYKTAEESDYHLCLAQIVDPGYTNVYGNFDFSNYVIMDNGAAEGETVRDTVLIDRATYYGVDEIVVPDVIGEATRTITRAKRFFEKYAEFDNFNYMGVVQSSGDYGSIMACVKAFAELPITTLGIPRHLVTKDKQARLNILNLLKNDGYHERFQVHLLGTNPVHVVEVSVIAEAHPWVRGVDSSLPYNYAIAGKRLNAKYTGNGGIGRPDKYFEEVRHIDAELLQDNIDTFIRWASGTEGTAR